MTQYLAGSPHISCRTSRPIWNEPGRSLKSPVRSAPTCASTRGPKLTRASVLVVGVEVGNRHRVDWCSRERSFAGEAALVPARLAPLNCLGVHHRGDLGGGVAWATAATSNASATVGIKVKAPARMAPSPPHPDGTERIIIAATALVRGTSSRMGVLHSGLST